MSDELLQEILSKLDAIEARLPAKPHHSRRWFSPREAAQMLGLNLGQLGYRRRTDGSWREGEHYRQENSPDAGNPRYEYNVAAIEALKSTPAGKRRVV